MSSSPSTSSPDLPTARQGTLTYVLITPARNEVAMIEQTIRSVISQTAPPLRWIIVSDGSTDGTDEVVKRYAAQYQWIELVRMPERKERHFAAKVLAFNAGRERVAHLNYEIIGNLDGDITFGEHYCASLLRKFEANPRLGVAGTPFMEESQRYDYRFTSIEHVSGACQMFRRQCFEEIGGYTPIKIGGIDLVAVMTARMKGWETRSFTDEICVHHRKMGTAKQGPLMVAFRGGKGDYILGGHPVWEFFRCIYQMSKRPFILAGTFRLVGFYLALMRREPKQVPPELVRFRRAEQMRRLTTFFKSIHRLRSNPL